MKSFTILLTLLILLSVVCSHRRSFNRKPRRRLFGCPHIRCAQPACDNPTQTYDRFRGRRCKACKVCPETEAPLPQCPDLTCPLTRPICAPDSAGLLQPLERQEVADENGNQCLGCYICPSPPPCPHVACLTVELDCEHGEPIPELLTNPNTGRVCTGCLKCPNPPPCSHVFCLAVELDCEHGPAEVELLTDPSTGEACSGCETCPVPPFCPHIICLAETPECAAGTGEPTHAILTSPFDDKPCRGCLQCPEQEGCTNGVCGHCIGPGPNRDIGLPDRCDHIDCSITACPNGKVRQPTCIPTFDGEDRCRACDDCIAADAIQWSECPSLSCETLTCDEGYRLVQTTFDTRLFPDGRTCAGCPACEPIPASFCHPICTAIFQECPLGEDFVRGAYRNTEGELCSTCPSCRRECPVFKCGLPDCPLGVIRDSQFISDGRLCTGCPECVEECTPLALLDCPRPECDNPVAQDFTLSDGTICTGCSTCDQDEY